MTVQSGSRPTTTCCPGWKTWSGSSSTPSRKARSVSVIVAPESNPPGLGSGPTGGGPMVGGPTVGGPIAGGPIVGGVIAGGDALGGGGAIGGALVGGGGAL